MAFPPAPDGFMPPDERQYYRIHLEGNAHEFAHEQPSDRSKGIEAPDDDCHRATMSCFVLVAPHAATALAVEGI